jgi:hypothetical protein
MNQKDDAFMVLVAVAMVGAAMYMAFIFYSTLLVGFFSNPLGQLITLMVLIYFVGDWIRKKYF